MGEGGMCTITWEAFCRPRFLILIDDIFYKRPLSIRNAITMPLHILYLPESGLRAKCARSAHDRELIKIEFLDYNVGIFQFCVKVLLDTYIVAKRFEIALQ